MRLTSRLFTMRHHQTTLLQSIPLLFLLRCAQIVRAQNINCYFPNGDAISDGSTPGANEFYLPCNQSFGNDNQHMCCKTASPFNDVCNPDGLCARDSNPGLGEDQGLMRSTCTDPSWTSPSCLNLCTTGIGKWLFEFPSQGYSDLWRLLLTAQQQIT